MFVVLISIKYKKKLFIFLILARFNTNLVAFFFLLGIISSCKSSDSSSLDKSSNLKFSLLFLVGKGIFFIRTTHATEKYNSVGSRFRKIETKLFSLNNLYEHTCRLCLQLRLFSSLDISIFLYYCFLTD